MASGSVRLGQSVAAALRRPDRTYGSGFHNSGGPSTTIMETWTDKRQT